MATRFLTLDGKIVKDTRTGTPVALTDNIFTNVTYEVLKTMRDNGHLLSGEQYRIVDFVTTTSQENTQSAGHPFDIIVVADSANTLNENARAVVHAGDTYFANSKLSAWEIKYCFDNDKTRFWWADETNGKGVIYYMKDEYGNECPYDFKNIQFDREGTDYYTFSWVDENNAVKDLSIVGNTQIYDDEGQITGCFGNKMGIASIYGMGQTADNPTNLALALPNNVFVNTHEYGGGIFYGCYSNTFGDNCFSNTFGSDCFDNTFGSECFDNTIGESSYSNTFGNNCYENTFGSDCFDNTFGSECFDNTIGESSYSNTFGNNCYENTFVDACSNNAFGNNCYENTFGRACEDNTFGNTCYSNTFGQVCQSNTFGDGCSSNTFGDYCSFNKVDNGVKNAQPQPIAGTFSSIMKGVHIHYGVTGQFTVTRGANYTQDVRTANDVTITV